MPTGGAVKLTIDSNKYGWVEFPDGTMQVTLSGVINTTYTGATGEIKYFVPKNNTGGITISNSSISGAIVYNGTNNVNASGNVLLTSIKAENSPELYVFGNTVMAYLIAGSASLVSASNCALTAKSIGDILFAAYVANRQNVNFNFSGGTNAASGVINTYLLATYGVTFATVYAALDVTGTILYNS